MTTVWAGLSVGAIYVLVALGYNIVFIASGAFNFAHANLIMIGVFLAYAGLAQHSWPLYVVFLVAGLGAMAAATIEERVAFRPVRTHHGYLVTSVGAATVMTGIVERVWGVQALQVPFLAHTGAEHSAPFTFLGGRTVPVELALIVFAIVASAVLYVALRYTLVGLAALATSEDSEAATARGIDTRRLSLAAFALSGLFAGVIGPLVGPKTYAFAALASALALKGFVAMALGGFGSISGCVVGGFAIGMVEACTARWWGGTYANLAVFVVLLGGLLIRPTGLLGEREERLV